LEDKLRMFMEQILQFMGLVESEDIGAQIQIRDGRIKTKLWIEEEGRYD